MKISDLQADLAQVIRRLVRDGWVALPSPELSEPVRVDPPLIRFRPDATPGDVEAAVEAS